MFQQVQNGFYPDGCAMFVEGRTTSIKFLRRFLGVAVINGTRGEWISDGGVGAEEMSHSRL